MPLKRVFNIFVASPGDVADERASLEEVVAEINIVNRSLGAGYELIKWETHTRPGFGDDAQDVINKQIPDDFQVFIGVMWTRFGTRTTRAESGTEEEFNRAFERWKREPSSVEIMLYFKDGPINPSKIDPEQFRKVEEFRKKVSSDLGGYSQKFETTEEFKNKVRVHLSTLLNELVRTAPLPGSTPSVALEPVAVPESDALALRNFLALQDEDAEEGLLDVTEQGVSAMGQVAVISNKLTETTERLSHRLAARTSEIKKVTALGLQIAPAEGKKHADAVGRDLEEFSSDLVRLIPEFRKQHGLAMEGITKLIMLTSAIPEKPETEMQFALASLTSLRTTMEGSSEKLEQLSHTMMEMPKLTAVFNKARRKAVALLTDLLLQINEAVSSTKDVENLLQKVLGPVAE